MDNKKYIEENYGLSLPEGFTGVITISFNGSISEKDEFGIRKKHYGHQKFFKT